MRGMAGLRSLVVCRLCERSWGALAEPVAHGGRKVSSPTNDSATLTHPTADCPAFYFPRFGEDVNRAGGGREPRGLAGG